MNKYVKNGFLSVLLALNGAALLTSTSAQAFDAQSLKGYAQGMIKYGVCPLAATAFAYVVHREYGEMQKEVKSLTETVGKQSDALATVEDIVAKQQTKIEALRAQGKASNLLCEPSLLYNHWQVIAAGTVTAYCLWVNREAIARWCKEKFGCGTSDPLVEVQ